MAIEFRKDAYKKARGGYSRLMTLFCRACGEKIAMYQKDGAGSLRRLYLDRILSPRKLATLENRRLDEIPKLTCPKCKEDIGVPHIYKKEKRKAFRLYQDALAKKIKKLEDQRRLGI